MERIHVELDTFTSNAWGRTCSSIAWRLESFRTLPKNLRVALVLRISITLGSNAAPQGQQGL